MRASVSYVRTRGLSVDSESGLREHLSQVPPELYDETLATGTRNLRARVERGGRPRRMLGRQHGGAGVVVRKVEDVGASGVTERHHRIDIEPRCLARSLATVAHPNRVRSNAREARRQLVPRQPSVKRTIPASHHPVGTEGVNKTRTIEICTLQQLWRTLAPLPLVCHPIARRRAGPHDGFLKFFWRGKPGKLAPLTGGGSPSGYVCVRKGWFDDATSF